jgi:hypothetical protein
LNLNLNHKLITLSILFLKYVNKIKILDIDLSLFFFSVVQIIQLTTILNVINQPRLSSVYVDTNRS